MRVQANRLELLAPAKNADSIAPKSAPLEILKCVLLTASEDGRLTVSATNLEVRLEQSITAEVLEPGSLVIGASLFSSMLSLLDGDTVEISGTDGKQACIAGGFASYIVPSMPSGEFPRQDMPFPEDTVKVTGIPAIARRTVFAASEDAPNPAMKCVDLVFTSEGMKVVGCDDSRLVSAKGSSGSAADARLLIPADSLAKLARLVGNSDELSVGTTGKLVAFIRENFIFTSRLIEGGHIDADKMLDSVRPEFSLMADAALLVELVSSVKTIAGKTSYFSLRFDGGKLSSRCESEAGVSEKSVDAVPLRGDPCGEYWYNGEKLLECVRTLRGAVVLEKGQNGILVLRTDDQVCMQTSLRRPAKPAEISKPVQKKKTAKNTAEKKAA